MSDNPFKGYRITSSFGYRIHPISGGQTFHRGIDLVTEPWNGPIHAFMDGTVRFAAEGATGSGFGGYGLTVAVQDHRGYLHCYAHLSRIAVKVGQQIKQGQLLGNQGSTGESTGPHVHYEVRKSSTPSYGYTASENGVVDPGIYLQSEYNSTVEGSEETPMTMEERERLTAMEKMLESQSAWIQQQKNIASMACPSWAEEAYRYYQPFIMNEAGSYDFWRLLVIMYRKEKGIKVSSGSSG
ncbi:M23 family metallopeptidase [Paenibacillus sp. 11B]|uniref:M23 family metallopeptidase n=1 Tax=unclassified Paenibacillus TaxID=185978 RepID=UPI0026539A74|nr:M23 family metallopeptidase [Paenibacillus sp. 11B]MDN8590029.1 M23 family metallopeptidase [Paenibacillus sp. 11B]